MVKIECIIKPFKLDEVRAALLQAGATGITATEVTGFGRQRGHTEIFRGSEYATTFLPKIKLEVVVPKEKAGHIVHTLIDAARTGEVGDGKIFVSPVLEAYRVRTGEFGSDAL